MLNQRDAYEMSQYSKERVAEHEAQIIKSAFGRNSAITTHITFSTCVTLFGILTVVFLAA